MNVMVITIIIVKFVKTKKKTVYNSIKFHNCLRF